MVFATRKGLPVDLKSCREGKDYYVRIADVIDRLNQRRSSEESAVADLYRRAISKPDFSKADFTSTPSFTRLNVGKLGSPKLDLSWKEGRTHFPKASSRIGNDYQVSTFPIAQCFDQTEEQSVAL